MIRSLTAAATLLLLALAARAGPDGDGAVGKPVPPWHLTDWINSAPLTVEGLRGKVVLVRWWTAPQCPHCAATAPSLNDFHKRYAGRGLVVVGAYHHKAKEPLRPGHVKEAAERFGFEFPVAIDHDWKTVKAWWLDSGDRRFTSVSFLIDRKGVVRHVHPGGTYAPGDAAHATMQKKIEELLNEK
jgi:thiol-disulfide isomerase/thioredoxin